MPPLISFNFLLGKEFFDTSFGYKYICIPKPESKWYVLWNETCLRRRGNSLDYV